MPDPKYDSGHIVVPVVHAESGELHNIAVPEGTAMSDLHDALSDAGYLHQTGPSKEGSLEYSEAFRKSASKAVAMANVAEARRKHGENAGGEAGFSITKDGSTSPVTFSQDAETSHGSLKQSVGPNDLGILHTHDSFHQPDPSVADQNVARNAKTNVYVASRNGLYQVSASGEVTNVFKSPTWYSDKNPK